MSNLAEEMLRYFDSAAVRGFPIFLGDEMQSTPINATPYLSGFDDFLRKARSWPGRTLLVERLQRSVAKISDPSIALAAILAGGRFTDLNIVKPNDIDSLWLYRSREGQSVDAGAIRAWQLEFKSEGIDARFIPIDGDFALAVKAISFFTILY